ncbi:hypothetical protein PR048_025516 [Dryococelus australis]|uniref:Uncharacterized protein n=1 Tax=Dryococelus australis TaxID=614101 RepID=A0ABQ9GRL5_9NEOP|nr:hypothetical protein PR048_025516 [Dryococelus australis]
MTEILQLVARDYAMSLISVWLPTTSSRGQITVAFDELANEKKKSLDSGQNAEKHENDPGSDSDKKGVSASSSVKLTESSKHRMSLSSNKGVTISPVKESIERKKDTVKWKRNVLRKTNNSGKVYEMHTVSKNIPEERAIKPPCSEKRTLQCCTKFSEEERKNFFSKYWNLEYLGKQRQYIVTSKMIINSKYLYLDVGGIRSPRRHNNAVYFPINDQQVRMCKVFLRNTFAIYARQIRKHGKQKAVDRRVKEGIKQNNESITKIESHYLSVNTSRHFIEGSKSIADIHLDYVASCKENNVPFTNYVLF